MTSASAGSRRSCSSAGRSSRKSGGSAAEGDLAIGSQTPADAGPPVTGSVASSRKSGRSSCRSGRSSQRSSRRGSEEQVNGGAGVIDPSVDGSVPREMAADGDPGMDDYTDGYTDGTGYDDFVEGNGELEGAVVDQGNGQAAPSLASGGSRRSCGSRKSGSIKSAKSGSRRSSCRSGSQSGRSAGGSQRPMSETPNETGGGGAPSVGSKAGSEVRSTSRCSGSRKSGIASAA